MESAVPILEFEGISKRFGGVQALEDVSFAIPRGEIHALVGENGAGKSTLIRICGGVYRPDAGSIRFKGKEHVFRTVHESRNAGISIVHQEIPICPDLTAAENIFLGRALPKQGGLIDWREVNRRTTALFAQLGVRIDPRAQAASLTIAQQQLVVIAQALSLESDLLIMDEPTSALNQEETSNLFAILRQLRDRGITIVYVSHRLEEVFEIADSISSLRDGHYIGTVPKAGATPDQIVRMMVGREVTNLFPKVVSDFTPAPLLRVRNLAAQGLFSDVSFDLFGGEVLGLVGLQGSGTSDVLRSLFGKTPVSSGEIEVNGKPAHFRSSLDAIASGIAYVPANRQAEGLFSTLSVRDNGALLLVRRLARALGLVPLHELDRQMRAAVQRFSIRTSSISASIGSLSGGNQQKVVIARSLSTGPLIVLLDDPTRGIDVGAKAEIHHILNELTAAGCGVILVSSELPEVLAMSDRVITMYRGRVRGELGREQIDHEVVMRMATGADGAVGASPAPALSA
ncbi:MAG: sugar ABC transporter ATP-binding protein [Anaerolineales bacterium]|nr:sugar ABC transporter ATP-binding protein [Anaerolineales bacterium]